MEKTNMELISLLNI